MALIHTSPPEFFGLGATIDCRPWAWCVGLQWEEGTMFHLGDGPGSQNFKRACAFWNRTPGLYIGETGSRWPDWIGSGGGIPRYYVSGRVVEGLDRAGIIYRAVYEMPIVSIASPKLKDVPPPRYYAVEAVETIPIGWVEEIVHDTNSLGEPLKPKLEKRIRIVAGGWNGADLLAIRRSKPSEQNYLAFFCTRKVVDLAAAEGWTGFEAEPRELM